MATTLGKAPAASRSPRSAAARKRRSQTPATVYTVIVTREPDGHYSGYAPALEDCGSFGDTLPEALQMTEEAIRLYLECRRELGWPIAPDDPHVSLDMSGTQEAFVYRLTVREDKPVA